MVEERWGKYGGQMGGEAIERQTYKNVDSQSMSDQPNKNCSVQAKQRTKWRDEIRIFVRARLSEITSDKGGEN